METPTTTPNTEKKRHGCITAWLALMIIANSITAFIYLFASDMVTNALTPRPSDGMILMLGLAGAANVAFSFLLLQWKKIGFWGFLITSILVLFINTKLGIDIGRSLTGLVGVGILYGILQFKVNGETAWENLK